MNERQRQDYLAAMGIQSWFPRFVLPQAKPSTTCDWNLETDPVQQPSAILAQPAPSQPSAIRHSSQPPDSPQPMVSTGDGAPQASNHILQELGFASPQSNTHTTDDDGDKHSKAPLALEHPPNPVIPEPFRLAAIDISETCLAVTDLPWSGLNQFTDCHHHLLRNIVLALQLPCDQQWKEGIFAWPILADAPPVDQRFAQEAVTAFLNNQFGLKRRKTILLFGHKSCFWLWSQTQDFDRCLGVHQRNSAHYGITRSLGELINIPALKADAWTDLKALRQPAH